MADGNIVLKIDAETGEAQKKVVTLEEKVEGLQKQIEKLGKMVEKGFGAVGEAMTDVKGETGTLGEELANVSGRVDMVANELHRGFRKGMVDVVMFNKALRDLQADIKKLEKMAKKQAKVVVTGFQNVRKEVKKVGKDVDKATEKIEEVGEAVEELEDKAKESEGAFDSIQSAIASGFEEVKSKVADVKEGVNTLNTQFGNFGKKAKGQLKQLDPGFANIKKGFMGMTDGLKASGKGFSGLNKIIAMGGIGLLLTILGSLIAYLKESEQGAKVFKKTMALLAIPLEVIGMVAEKIGEALVWAFTSPKEAMDSLGVAIQGLWQWILDLLNLAIAPLQLGFYKTKEALLEGAIAVKEFFGGDASNLKRQLRETRNNIQEVKDQALASAKAVAKPFVDGANALAGMAREQYRLVQLQTKYDKMVKKNAQTARLLAIAEADINKKMADREAIVDDEEASYGRRVQALQEQVAMHDLLFEAQLKQMDADIEAMRISAELAETEKDRLAIMDEIAEAIAERTEAEAEHTQARREYAQTRKQLAEDEAQRVLDIEDMLADALIDSRKDTLSMQMKSDLEDLERQRKADIAELRELKASREQIAQMEAYYRDQEDKMREEYRIEQMEQELEIAQMIQDINAEAQENSLSAQHKFALKELDQQMQADLRELDTMEATEEQKEAMRQAYAERRITLLEQQGQELAEQEREKEAMLREIQNEAFALSLENMVAQENEREAMRRQMDFDSRMEDLRLAEEQALLDLEMLEATEAQKQAIRDYYNDVRREEEHKLARDLREIEMRSFQEKVNLAHDAGKELLSALREANDRAEADNLADAKRQFETNKKLQKAQTIISGSAGIIGQLAVPQDQLTGANFVKAGMIATSMATQLANIESATFDSSKWESDVEDGNVQVQPLDLSFLQRETEESGAVRAYVVNQDVQNAEMQQTLIDNKVNLG